MFSFQSVKKYHHELLAGNYTCADTVRHYLQQIKANEILNAFTEVYAEEAIAKAAELDEKRKSKFPLKKLHGVVIAIKDVICYKDHQVTAASRMLKDFRSLYTATALQFLLDEDAIIIACCNCDEFAMGSSNENSAYGKVLNALDHTKVPGGSSGGSAVAVQAGMCMLSLGSDTGGSVRQPADFCGIIGYKPSYGIISRYGLIAYASSFDQIGIFGNNIADVSLLLEIMAQPDKADSTMNTADVMPVLSAEPAKEKKYKFAFLKQAVQHPAIDKEIAGKIIILKEELMAEGHEVNEIDFDLLDYIVPAYYVLTTAEAGSNLSRYDGIRYGYRSEKEPADLNEFYFNNRTEGFGTEVKRRIMLGAFVLSTGYYDAFYTKAQKVRRLLIDQVNKIFTSHDALIMPVSPTTAFPAGQHDKDPVAMYLADIFTVFANLTGIPSVAVPLFSHSNQLPFGVQVLCRRNDDALLLGIADMLMENKNQLAV